MLKDMKIATELAHHLGIPIDLGDAVKLQLRKSAEATDISIGHDDLQKRWDAEAHGQVQDGPR